MKLFKELFAEIVFLSGLLTTTVGMILFMNWQIALIFFGAALMVIAAYITNVMNVEAE